MLRGNILKKLFLPRWPHRGVRVISTQMKADYEPPSMSLKELIPMKGTLRLQDQATFLVMVYINEALEKLDLPRVKFSQDQVYLVWFSKTLQNWKALVGTTLSDEKYYEVTHNGDKNETYVDVYLKVANICYPGEFHQDERKEL
jgi:hypothetical protein